VTTTAMVDAYVRQLLTDEHGDELEVLGDGHYRVPVAGGIRVAVLEGNRRTRRVLVTAPVLEVVAATPELLELLNDLNAATPYGRYFHVDDEVMVETTVHAEDLQPSALFSSLSFVAWATETQGERLVEQLGRPDAATLDDPAPEVHLADRAGPIGDRAARVVRSRERVVNASGYL
jgi:hypothetical protein